MDCLSRHTKMSTHGADAWSYYAMLCKRNACDGRACAGTVFEKAHARMKRIHSTCNGKYTENCWALETLLAGLH